MRLMDQTVPSYLARISVQIFGNENKKFNNENNKRDQWPLSSIHNYQ